MNPVSSMRALFGGLLLVLLSQGFGVAMASRAQASAPAKTEVRVAPAPRDPRKVFEEGEAALRAGKLEEAESDFRQVLAIDSSVAGAYANLGVIEMRRKQWPQAIQMLRQAEKLAPDLAGIRLNIGLLYFRQGDFQRAIHPFESVVKQLPDSYQAHYLLGLCYFFNDRWADTIGELEPLWAKSWDQLNYLYVLEHAADKAGNSALEKKAMARLVTVGEGSPEFHLLMGKAHLNRGEYDDAVKELEAAVEADPKLTFVHFNLGLAYAHQQNYDRARAEFHKDIALEPDVPFAYEQLGSLESTVGNEDEALRNYHSELKLDPHSISARLGLAKIEEHQHHYPAALSHLDEVVRLSSANASAHYLRGQVLARMGRYKESRQELAVAAELLNEQRAARHKELEGETVPSPELAREPE
jgi:tetratricopeptide (TPR) repeat protein